MAPSLLLLDVCLGVGLLAAIALAARRTPVSMSSRSKRLVGWALIAVPLPLAVALHLFVWPASAFDHLAFVAGVVAFAAGAFLVLPSDDRDDRREESDDQDPPPWWPDFDRDFRAYARTSRPRVHA